MSLDRSSWRFQSTHQISSNSLLCTKMISTRTNLLSELVCTYDDLVILGKHVLSILHHYSITIFLPHKPKPNRVWIIIINPRIILKWNLNLYFKNKWIDQSIEIKVYHLWSRTSWPALWFINRIHVEGHKGSVGY